MQQAPPEESVPSGSPAPSTSSGGADDGPPPAQAAAPAADLPDAAGARDDAAGPAPDAGKPAPRPGGTTGRPARPAPRRPEARGTRPLSGSASRPKPPANLVSPVRPAATPVAEQESAAEPESAAKPEPPAKPEPTPEPQPTPEPEPVAEPRWPRPQSVEQEAPAPAPARFARPVIGRTPPVVPPRAPDVALPPPSVLPTQARRRAALGSGVVGRRTLGLSVLLVATLAVAAGAVVLDRSSSTPTATAPSVPRPSASAPAVPGATAPAAPGATVPAAPAEVLPGLDLSAPQPSPAALQRVLGPLLRTRGLGSSVSAEVVDLASGASLLSVAPDRPAVPASSAKLLTGAAALSLLGPSARLATTVVDGGKDEVVLVGGGDVTLAAGHGVPGGPVGRAGIADLADGTADALRRQGRGSVAVRLDDTLFKGPTTSPAWSAGDVRGGFIAPVTALAVNSGSATPAVPLVPGEAAERVADPSMAAARLFARALEKDGITVTGSVVRARAPDSATELARVDSAPVADLVEHALTDSDNTVAEALARMVAVKAGRQATFADAGVAVLDRVDLLGVPTAGARLSGGSGLGSGNEVSARALATLLVLAASPQHPELRALLSGLPVAGASGTLAERFATDRERSGLGVVRAKTGTLTGASSLSGTVVDADGRQL
ncbi:MAG TPA: D-alanyl-D-alanine carboxypeptidase/D-alanyl-D-alanine-endopeptidase, partial [Kineosporiaceae bacterium]|nr:D-alanyl-D-alanine carboxypeptidase/D-alanyl-D-alanine-endopeptidase [Kineosporiaceae bacterium]